jgi:hypothetical protein
MIINNIEYQIVLGENLKRGDTIIHRGAKFILSEYSLGKFAGSMDFGEYIAVKGYYKGQPQSMEDFWIYRLSPMVKEMGETHE